MLVPAMVWEAPDEVLAAATAALGLAVGVTVCALQRRVARTWDTAMEANDEGGGWLRDVAESGRPGRPELLAKRTHIGRV